MISVAAKFMTNKLAGTLRIPLVLAIEMRTRELPPIASIEIHIIGMAFPIDDHVMLIAVESFIVR